MSIVGDLINLMGLTGSVSTNNLSNMPRPQSQQDAEFTKTGETANPDIWAAYNGTMRMPPTLDAAYQLWDEMANWDLIAAAISEIVQECLPTDAMHPNAIWYKCNKPDVEDKLNDMLNTVGAEDILPSQVWHVVAFGNNFDKIEYSKGEGVHALAFAHPMEMRRYWLERTRKCIGYRWAKRKPPEQIIPLDIAGATLDRAKLQLSNNQHEDLWYPWDFMHMRRMFKLRHTEHGEPLFNDAQLIYKKLRMALDQMVVHRAQIQPDRYAINIDVKDQIPTDQMKTIQRWKQTMRSKISYGGPNSPFGSLDEFKSFHNAMALDTILWIAKPRDFQHGIEKLAGTATVPDVYDIELLTNLFFSIIGMPKSWVSGASGGEGAPVSGKALLAQDMRFLRKIKSVRKPIVTSYTWLGYFHALLTGEDISGLEIQAEMSPIGSLEDQLKLELLSTQADVLAKLGDVMSTYQLPREVWIDYVFRKYMRLPDDVVNIFITALPQEATQESAKGAPSGKKIMEDIVSKLGDTSPIISQIHELLDGKAPTRRKYRKVAQVMDNPTLQESDLIVSGYGQINPIKDFPADAEQTTTTTTSIASDHKNASESLFESKGYRTTMGAHLKTRG